MTRWLAATLLLLAGAAPPPAPAPAPDPAAVTSLEFEPFDERMTVPVQVAGAGPYRFIIDTGAQRTVISRQLAGRLGLPAGPNVRLTAMTGTSTVGTVVVPNLSVSVIGGERIEAPVLEASDMGAPGILGIDTLQAHAVQIDFDTQSMAIAPAVARTKKRERVAADEVVVYAKSLFGQLVVTDAYIGSTRVRVVLDTGSSVTVGNSALRRKLLRRGKGQDIQLKSVTGGILHANYTAADGVKLGDITIDNLPIAFADAPPFRAFGLQDKPAMLLGMDALQLFRRVRIDFANRELRIKLPKDAQLRPVYAPVNTRS